MGAVIAFIALELDEAGATIILCLATYSWWQSLMLLPLVWGINLSKSDWTFGLRFEARKFEASHKIAVQTKMH